MDRISIVLVEPLYPANIGYIARLMKNFNLRELYIVGSRSKINIRESYKYAVHASDILDKARIVPLIKEALEDSKMIIGTTAKPSSSPRNIGRNSLTVKEFVGRLKNFDDNIAILFGREDYGLNNDELEACDLIVNIPASPLYRTLNVSHAVSIILYEIYDSLLPHPNKSLPDRIIFNTILDVFKELVASLRLPIYRQILIRRAFRNIISRSMISTREATLILGALRKILDSIRS